MEEKSKVYAKIDFQGRVVAVDGGYTMPIDLTGWIKIDEGYGDKYNLCQSHYLPMPITDDRGIFRYKWTGGSIVERSAEEMDADYIPPVDKETDDFRITQLEEAFELLLSGRTNE